MSKEKIIVFPQGSLREAISELLKRYEEGRVDNLVLAYTSKLPEEKPEEGTYQNIGYYWFGEKSTLYCLGLATSLVHRVRDYMEGVGDE